MRLGTSSLRRGHSSRTSAHISAITPNSSRLETGSMATTNPQEQSPEDLALENVRILLKSLDSICSRSPEILSYEVSLDLLRDGSSWKLTSARWSSELLRM